MIDARSVASPITRERPGTLAHWADQIDAVPRGKLLLHITTVLYALYDYLNTTEGTSVISCPAQLVGVLLALGWLLYAIHDANQRQAPGTSAVDAIASSSAGSAWPPESVPSRNSAYASPHSARLLVSPAIQRSASTRTGATPGKLWSLTDRSLAVPRNAVKSAPRSRCSS